MDGTEYITLKEAGEISGYSPDYIGQLIRRGKISGKQVYANVAWVTTRDAMSEYLSEKGKAKRDTSEDEVAPRESVPLRTSDIHFPEHTPSAVHNATSALRHGWLERLFQITSRIIIVFAVLFLIFLFHVLSTLLDDRLERRALERLGVVSTTVPS